MQALISYLEHEAQPMIVLDPDHIILAANTAYKRQFGTTDKPYVGHKCYRVSHHYDVPCDQAGEHCPMKKAFELKGPDRVLHIHHTARARTRGCGTAAHPRRQAPGCGRALGDEDLKRLALDFKGTRRELAEHAGLSERTLYRRLKDLGLA